VQFNLKWKTKNGVRSDLNHFHWYGGIVPWLKAKKRDSKVLIPSHLKGFFFAFYFAILGKRHWKPIQPGGSRVGKGNDVHLFYYENSHMNIISFGGK